MYKADILFESVVVVIAGKRGGSDVWREHDGSGGSDGSRERDGGSSDGMRERVGGGSSGGLRIGGWNTAGRTAMRAAHVQ